MTALSALPNLKTHPFRSLFVPCVAFCLGWMGFGVHAQEWESGGFDATFSPDPAVSSPDFQASQFPQAPQFPQTSQVPSDFPKIRKLGKLVSIEGAVDDPRIYREDTSRISLSPEETGAEMEQDPNLELGEFQLPPLSYFACEPYSNYRTDEDDISFMPGGGDQFGWLSFQYAPYKKSGYKSGFITGFNLHLLSGPDSVALPARLYDFSFGYQKRGRIQDAMSYDLASTIGVFSDFEDSAREGIRYPGHAVGMLHYTPEFDIVFGVDYLSRDDIKILPVMGFSWRPQAMPDLRIDMVFPRPRIDYSLTDSNRVYLAGRLGGGTWDIEFPDNANDVMTYRDLQVLLGFESRDSDNAWSAIEFGYVFDRSLEFRTQAGETRFDDAFMLRFVTRH
jgi:hypothetical protein